MRKIVVLSMVSLDGVMQAPGGPEEDPSRGFKYGGWTAPYVSEAGRAMLMEQLAMPFDLLLGRKTYDMFSGFWSQQTGPIADAFNKATKYVVSGASPELGWKKSELISGDVVAGLKQLKQQEGPILQVHGSGKLVQTLLKNDLVDELWLRIFPVTLGGGKRLFAEGTVPTSFELIESKSTPTGAIFASYKKAGPIKTG